MTRTQLLIAVTTGALAALTACDSDATAVNYLRCWPTFSAEPAPAEGAPGDTVTLTGHHLLSYLSGAYDPAIDLVVKFGDARATVLGTVGPYEEVEGACAACEACVTASEEGCLSCDLHCDSCFADVLVIAPQGEGAVPVRLYNGMGESGTVTFTYTGGGPGTATPSPTAAVTPTPTSTPGSPTPGTPAPGTPAPPSPSP